MSHFFIFLGLLFLIFKNTRSIYLLLSLECFAFGVSFFMIWESVFGGLIFFFILVCVVASVCGLALFTCTIKSWGEDVSLL